MNNKTWINQLLNWLLLATIAILILMSILALFVIHLPFWDKTKFHFSFTPSGINNYLTAFGQYKALFTATVATIAAYYGLWRFQVAADQNRDKLKQDRFTEWRTVLENRFTEIERKDPFMRREFVRIRLNFFNQLYDLGFNIDNNQQLTTVFQNIFKDHINFFEIQNNRHIGMGGVYPNLTYSYSFDSFRFLFLGCVDNIYPQIVTDLERLYLASIDPNRLIDVNSFRVAQQNYRPI